MDIFHEIIKSIEEIVTDPELAKKVIEKSLFSIEEKTEVFSKV